MAEIIRLSSGGTVVINTGTLAGIGPVGPTGPQGLTGPQGPQGPQGNTGPMGSIEEGITELTGSVVSSTSNVNTNLVFNSETRDDFDIAVAGGSGFWMPSGIWHFTAVAYFQKPVSTNANGQRYIHAVYDSVTRFSNSTQPHITLETPLLVSGMLDTRSNPDKTLLFRVFSTDTQSVPVWGRVVITKIGPGARGPIGATGPQGPIGLTGPEGPAGPGLTDVTFSDLGDTGL